MLGQHDAYKSISIRKHKLNGVRLEAIKHKRSDGQQLEYYLDKAGVRDYTDQEYEQQKKLLGLEEEKEVVAN
jgi:hypothetical protein